MTANAGLRPHTTCLLHRLPASFSHWMDSTACLPLPAVSAPRLSPPPAYYTPAGFSGLPFSPLDSTHLLPFSTPRFTLFSLHTLFARAFPGFSPFPAPAFGVTIWRRRDMTSYHFILLVERRHNSHLPCLVRHLQHHVSSYTCLDYYSFTIRSPLYLLPIERLPRPTYILRLDVGAYVTFVGLFGCEYVLCSAHFSPGFSFRVWPHTPNDSTVVATARCCAGHVTHSQFVDTVQTLLLTPPEKNSPRCCCWPRTVCYIRLFTFYLGLPAIQISRCSFYTYLPPPTSGVLRITPPPPGLQSCVVLVPPFYRLNFSTLGPRY